MWAIGGGSLVPLFFFHNLLWLSALPQPEIFGPNLVGPSHSGFEDLRSSNLNFGTLCQVYLCLCVLCWKIGLWFCSQVVISTLHLVMMALSQLLPWWLTHPQLLWNGFLPWNTSAEDGVSISALLVFCFGHFCSSLRPAACLDNWAHHFQAPCLIEQLSLSLCKCHAERAFSMPCLELGYLASYLSRMRWGIRKQSEKQSCDQPNLDVSQGLLITVFASRRRP